MGIRERLKQFLKTIPNAKGKIGIGETEFEAKIGLKRSAVSNIGEGVSTTTLEKIITHYPQLNLYWLITGATTEPMLRTYAPTIIENADQQSHEVVLTRILALEELIVEVGLGKNWNSIEAGQARLSNLISEAVVKMKASGTRA